MILYHRTTAASAEEILRDGFRDGTGTYPTMREHTGVWLSNRPLNIAEGAEGDTLLQVELAEDAIADYEWIEEGKPYREWLIPARLINAQGTVRVVNEPEPEPLLEEYLAARELAIEIAAFSESSGREIEEIFAAVLERCGSPELGGLSEEIVAAAYMVRARIVELRRDFLEIADKKGRPPDHVDEWLRKAIDMLLNEERSRQPSERS